MAESVRQRSGRKQQIRSWALVALCSGLIYATVPLVRSMQQWVVERLGSGFFGYLTLAGLAAGLIAAVIVLWRRAMLRAASVAWLVGVVAIAAGWTWKLWERPEEAVHFLEYGLLGLLLTSAFRHHLRDHSAFVGAVIVAAMIGLVDELIQWATPRRYFDLRDVRLNTCAAVLAQIAVWKGLLPRGEVERPGLRGARLVVRLAMVLVLLLVICFSATPQRLEAVAERLPWMRPVLDPGDVIVEYGHRHEVEGIGVFRSRLTLAELAAADRLEGEEAGEEIRRFKGSYAAFLQRFTPGAQPLLYEARVHIFSRNRNIAEADQLEKAGDKGTDEWRERLLRAERENRILESFYATTLRASGFKIGPRMLDRFDAAGVTAEGGRGPSAFESRVGSHLLTVMTEGALRALLIVTLLLLAAVDLLLGRLIRRQRVGETS